MNHPQVLVGGFKPSDKNMKVSWDDDIPNIWENKKCSKPPTRVGLRAIQPPFRPIWLSGKLLSVFWSGFPWHTVDGCQILHQPMGGLSNYRVSTILLVVIIWVNYKNSLIRIKAIKGTVTPTIHHSPWGRSEVVIIYPDNKFHTTYQDRPLSIQQGNAVKLPFRQQTLLSRLASSQSWYFMLIYGSFNGHSMTIVCMYDGCFMASIRYNDLYVIFVC